MSRSNHGSRKATEENAEMKVIKRNGKTENISFDKILRRLKKIGKGNNIKINYTSLAIRIIDQLYTKIPTTKIDELTAEQCASMSSISPDYEVLALHIIVSNHHKNTQASFAATMNELYNFRDVNGAHTPLVADSFIEIVRENAEFFDGLCDFKRDYLLSYFGFKTLEKSYLMHVNKRIVERPQHMWLRVAIGIHGRDLENVRRTYDLMSQKKFTHATPTLFNSGTPRPQLSSCFLLAMDEDSIEGIFNTISECALISKWSGGIGVACSKIRAKGSIIRGTNGSSNGIVPMLRVFNSTCLYVDQCFTPETIIYTTDGPQQIQNVRAGETVIYNVTGGTEKIRDVLEHAYDGAMCVVKSPVFMENMRVTPQHPIAVIRLPDNFVPSNDTVEEITEQMMFEEPAKIHRAAQWRDYLNNPSLEVEWIEAADLSAGTDMIVYAVPQEPAASTMTAAPSLETCFMYGLMLAEGDMLNSETHASVSFYKKYDNIREFLDVYFARHFVPVEITEEEYPVKDWNKVTYKWKKTVDLPFRFTDFYRTPECVHKRIHPSWLQLPNTHIKEILRAMFFSYSILKIGNELFFDNASRELVEGMRYMFLRLGVLCGGYKLQTSEFENMESESPRASRLNPTYVIKVPRNETVVNILYGDSKVAPAAMEPAAELYDNGPSASAIHPLQESALSDKTYMTYKNFLLAPVTEVQTTIYKGTLYDLKMPTEHNYMIHHGVVHNGGGKRNGSFAIYLEPWHADVEEFLQMRKNHGDENLKARDLFYALWIPDLFMKRVKEEGTWTLMCPNECPGLCDVYGEEFEALYTKYEQEHRGRRTVDARKLWLQILDAQMETGTPYLVYKDSVNRKSNQKNIGTIKSSNLCVAPETMVLTDRGNVEIRELWQNQEKVRVWNGAEFSEVEIVKTGENQKLIDISIEDTVRNRTDTRIISCTLYHKFFVYDEQGNVVIKQAQQLRVGDKLQNFNLPDENFTHDSVFISNIIDEGRRDDTYCFTEPLRHAGIFNGILTSQCSEIVEYTDKNETAVCNLASIALPAYVKKEGAAAPTYDFAELHEVAKVVTYNLNRVIDVNYYPNEKTRRSNMRHRPIGLGVQGLADVFMMMGLPFQSDEARTLNRQIFETIYHAALESSCEIAEKEGAYETFAGSPASEGLLQFDLWGVDPGTERYDWPALKNKIRAHGLRNSLLVAPMPTASTSQILGYNECFEPITSNIYSRRTLAGDFVVVNRYMMEDLIQLGLWTKELKDNVIANNGSIQHLDIIPAEIRKKYMTVWEMSPKTLIDMAADRGAFICQSMSLNLWVEDPTYSILTKMHFYAYEKGLKTGIYYLRRRARHQAQQFTIKPEKAQIKEDEICEMCSA